VRQIHRLFFDYLAPIIWNADSGPDSLTTLVPYSAREHTRRALLLSEMVFVSSARLSHVACTAEAFSRLGARRLIVYMSHNPEFSSPSDPKFPTNGPRTSTNSVIPRFLGRSFSHLCEIPVFLTVVCLYGRYREYYSPSRRPGRLSVAFPMRSRCFHRPTHSIPNRSIFEFTIRP
jgi:hypothetical protein